MWDLSRLRGRAIQQDYDWKMRICPQDIESKSSEDK